MLEVKHLKKSFRVGLRRREIKAVRDVSFTVQKREIVGLIGPNGAGKTTAMKCITGLVTPDTGMISLDGKPTKETKSRARLGYLPEGPYFYEHLKIEELLRFYGQLYGIPHDILEGRIQSLIQRVGLDHARDRTLGKFSKGMRQRAGMAQSLINEPDFVILDEPQTGLDPAGRKDMRDIMLDVNRNGKTILFSSHILSDVEALCDRVVVIHQGKTVGEGTIDELTQRETDVVDVIIHGHLPEDFPTEKLSIEPRAHLTQIRIDASTSQSDLIRDLISEGLEIHSVTPHKLDLEDVFLQKTEDR